MSDAGPTAGDAGDPAGSADLDREVVPDHEGELEHTSAAEPATGEAGGETRAGPVDARTLVVLSVIVLAVGALALWAVLARGPGSRPETVATTTPAITEADAAALFAQNCAACHGPAGTGIPGGSVPPLAGSGTTAQAVVDRVLEGAPGMPSFRGTLSDVEIATVAAYVAALGQTG